MVRVLRSMTKGAVRITHLPALSCAQHLGVFSKVVLFILKAKQSRIVQFRPFSW